MNSAVCVDASVIIKLLIAEADSPQARALWNQWITEEQTAIAPYHLAYETASVIRNHVYRHDLTPQEGEIAVDTFHNLRIVLLHPQQLLRSAWGFAGRFNRPNMYDCYYLALAQSQGCELWTADQRLYNAVRQELSWVKWLGDYSP